MSLTACDMGAADHEPRLKMIQSVLGEVRHRLASDYSVECVMLCSNALTHMSDELDSILRR